MEHERQLRLLIPPSIFAAALFWGAILDPSFRVRDLLASQQSETELSRLIPLLFAGGVAIIAMGFVISTVAILMLRVLFVVLHRLGLSAGGYEGAVSKEAFSDLWTAVTGEDKPLPDHMMHAVAAFDHCLLPKNLHAWVGRRWNVFMVSSNAAVAVVFAHVIAALVPALRIASTRLWSVSDGILFGLLLCNAFIARRQALRMLEFAAQHSIPARLGNHEAEP